MYGRTSIRAAKRSAGYMKRASTYSGDGTASLSDSLRALITDMNNKGYNPATTPVFE